MITRHIGNGLRMGVVAALVACSGVAVNAQSRTVSLSSGTVLAVHLNDELTSNNSRKGDRFSATVEDKDSNGDYNSTALPVGAKVQGYIRSVQPKKDKNPGVLDIAFNKVVMPDGRSYSIDGSLISLDNKSVQKDSQGRLIAKKAHKTDRLTYVGYGAAGGAIIGLLTSRKHIFEDAALGAAAGYVLGALDKSKQPNDVKLKSGTQLGVRLDSRLSYSRN